MVSKTMIPETNPNIIENNHRRAFNTRFHCGHVFNVRFHSGCVFNVFSLRAMYSICAFTVGVFSMCVFTAGDVFDVRIHGNMRFTSVLQACTIIAAFNICIDICMDIVLSICIFTCH